MSLFNKIDIFYKRAQQQFLDPNAIPKKFDTNITITPYSLYGKEFQQGVEIKNNSVAYLNSIGQNQEGRLINNQFPNVMLEDFVQDSKFPSAGTPHSRLSYILFLIDTHLAKVDGEKAREFDEKFVEPARRLGAVLKNKMDQIPKPEPLANKPQNNEVQNKSQQKPIQNKPRPAQQPVVPFSIQSIIMHAEQLEKEKGQGKDISAKIQSLSGQFHQAMQKLEDMFSKEFMTSQNAETIPQQHAAMSKRNQIDMWRQRGYKLEQNLFSISQNANQNAGIQREVPGPRQFNT